MDLDTASYEEIEKAVLATERGRWFLSEHARRAQRQEIAALQRAVEELVETRQRITAQSPIEALVARLESALAAPAEPRQPPQTDQPASLEAIDELPKAATMRMFL